MKPPMPVLSLTKGTQMNADKIMNRFIEPSPSRGGSGWGWVSVAFRLAITGVLDLFL